MKTDHIIDGYNLLKVQLPASKVKDGDTGPSKSFFCPRSSWLDGNPPVHRHSLQFTPPWCEICEEVGKKEKCLQTW